MNILGTSNVSVEAAQAWARSVKGHDRFINVAPLYFEMAPRYGVRPEVAYAQAAHETARGHYTGVVGPERHNWCGLKKATGGGNSDPDAHAVFPDDRTGVTAHVQHLWRYTGKTRGELPVGEQLVDPRFDAVTKFTQTVEGLGGAWAPAPTYGLQVMNAANALIDFANNGTWEPPVPRPDILTMLLPDGASNKPNRGMTPRYITIHETANPSAGADALMHGRWLQNLARDGADEPSWHFTVDEDTIVQHLRLNEMGWHAGDGANGTGNKESIGIELCVNSGADLDATRERAARLVAWLMKEHRIPVTNVVQHNRWSGKDCPHLIRAANLWGAFLAMVQESEPEPTPTPPVDTVWKIPGNPFGDFGFRHGFKDTVEKLARAKYPQDMNAAALSITGYPREDEHPIARGSEQECERVTLIWRNDGAAPWDVVFQIRERN